MTHDQQPQEQPGPSESKGLPKIYIFSNVQGGGDGVCFAIAEDGECLGSHWCSHERFAKYDLGMVDGARQDRRDAYAAHYTGGYEFEFIPASKVTTHSGLKAAYQKNQALAEKEPQ